MSKKRSNKLNFVWVFLLVVLIAFVAYFVISGKAKQLYDKLYPDNLGNEVIVNGKTVTFSTEDNDLNVTFIELLNNDGSGSIGDSIFIQCGDVDVLIDAGTKSSGIATVVPFLESKIKDNILELAICTHPDSDHIGGFVGNKKSSSSMDYNGVLFMNEITISYLVDFGYESDTVVYDAYKKQVDTLVSKGMKYIPIQNVFNDSTTSQEPSIFNLGLNTKLTLLDYLTYKDSTIKDDNDRSVCCLVESSDKKFLLTGDAEVKEEAILSNLEIGHVDVFKSNHHGSPTANSKGLLDAITPDYIVITSSATNSYFLPKKKIVQRLYSYTDKTYATFLDGNITFNCKKGVITVFSTKTTLTNILTSSWYLADDEKESEVTKMIRVILFTYIACLAIMSIVAIIFYGVDKVFSKKGWQRAPEKLLLFITQAFGGIGSIIGIFFFHHKTKHWYFIVNLMVALLWQLGLLIILVLRFHNFI